MSIETNIKHKFLILYLFAAIAVVALIGVFYSLRSDISDQRREIVRQQQSLRITNDLILAVGRAQSESAAYFSSGDPRYNEAFRHSYQRIKILQDSLVSHRPVSGPKLKLLSDLLEKQASNMKLLSGMLNGKDMFSEIQALIRKYKAAPRKDTMLVTTQTQRVIRNKVEKKNIFKRIGEVFKPGRDSQIIEEKRSIDTLSIGARSPMLEDVELLTGNSAKKYDSHMKSIGREVESLVAAERDFSAQMSDLLIALHQESLLDVLASVNRSEKVIRRNYNYSIGGGFVALLLILLFILMIWSDVNKGARAREQIRQLMESRHCLLLAVSHDIKSPLGSIMGYLELWKSRGEDVKSMQNSARHILALLENLLEFSSMEMGSMQQNHTVFELKALADEVGEMFEPLAKHKELHFQWNADQVRLLGDPMKIRQILINLVSNAIKYTQKGKVTFSIRYANGILNMQVEDTGAGIPQDKLSEIYKPFVRIKENNMLASGSGLGMSLVKGLVDLLNGSIKVSSKVGQGSVFEVALPMEEAKQEISKGTRRIVVFDDDPASEAVAKNLLRKLGHKIVEEDYEIILTDMEMGELSGMDVLASAQGLPVVLMSGRSGFTEDDAKKLGFAAFIPKPLMLEKLRNVFGEGSCSEDELMGDDKEHILEIFRVSTEGNFELLKASLESDDFARAQAVCHKMLPMFAQLGYPTDALVRMDKNRKGVYVGWREDVKEILEIII